MLHVTLHRMFRNIWKCYTGELRALRRAPSVTSRVKRCYKENLRAEG